MGKLTKTTLPRKAHEGVSMLHVPESDTGRPPEYGKAIEITLFKELCKLAPYVSNKGCPVGRKAYSGLQ